MTSSDGMGKEPHLPPQHYELNAIQHCWIGQEYRFAGDIKPQCGPTSLGEGRLNRTARSVPSLFEGIAQNKAQTLSPKGGTGGKILQE